MNSEIFIEKFESLSNSEQKEIVNLIDFLRAKKKRSINYRKKKTVNIEDEKFVGMWKDRTDLTDCSKWVRNMRKREWN